VEYKSNAYKVTLMFPMQDNDGKAFPRSVWKRWRLEMGRLLSGFTDAGLVEGHWQQQTDLNKIVFIVVNSETKVNELRDFLREARVRFGQKAMYFEFHPVFQEDVR
jgi:hypothetical protein